MICWHDDDMLRVLFPPAPVDGLNPVDWVPTPFMTGISPRGSRPSDPVDGLNPVDAPPTGFTPLTALSDPVDGYAR